MTNSRNTIIYNMESLKTVSKYSLYENLSHYMAVACGEKRYLLTILTNLDLLEIASQEYGIFRNLSLLFANYSAGVCESENGGDTVIIKISKLEENEMILPKDPYMLLSAVNMKLRDYYPALDILCEDMGADKDEIIAKLREIGYEYDEGHNRFI